MVFLSWISFETAVSVVPINFKTPSSPFKKPLMPLLRENQAL